MATRFGWSNIFIISSTPHWHPHPQPSILQSFPVNVEPGLSFQRFLLSKPSVPSNCPAPSGDDSPESAPSAVWQTGWFAWRKSRAKSRVLFGDEFHLGAPPMAPVRNVVPQLRTDARWHTEAWNRSFDAICRDDTGASAIWHLCAMPALLGPSWKQANETAWNMCRQIAHSAKLPCPKFVLTVPSRTHHFLTIASKYLK